MEWTPTPDTAIGILGFFASVIPFLRQFGIDAKAATIEQYVEWARRQEHVKITSELDRILTVMSKNNAVAIDLFEAIKQNLSLLPQIEQQTRLIPDMKRQIEDILGRLSSPTDSEERRHRLRLSAKLLEIAAQDLPNKTGFHSRLTNLDLARSGTMLFRWRIEKQSPNMLLVEYLGGLLENRIGVVLWPGPSFELRVFDSLGNKYSAVTPGLYVHHRVVIIAVTWVETRIALWIDGEEMAQVEISKPFDRLGPFLMGGIDLDGDLGADGLIVGYEIDGFRGLHLSKQGFEDGGVLSDVALFGYVLSKEQIKSLAEVSRRDLH